MGVEAGYPGSSQAQLTISLCFLFAMSWVMNAQAQRLGTGSSLRGAPPPTSLARPVVVPTKPQQRSSESISVATGGQHPGVRASASSNEQAVFVLSRADEGERDALRKLLMLNKTASNKVGSCRGTVRRRDERGGPARLPHRVL